MVQEHLSTHCRNTGTEMIIDYYTDFTTYEIFQSRKALIKWAREVGKSHGFMIAIKKSDAPQEMKRKEEYFLVVSVMENIKEK